MSEGFGGQSGKGLLTLDGLATIEMGARQYVPLLGQFLSVDPVSGGNANDYAYPNDPINDSDFTGKYGFRINDYGTTTPVVGSSHRAGAAAKTWALPSAAYGPAPRPAQCLSRPKSGGTATNPANIANLAFHYQLKVQAAGTPQWLKTLEVATFNVAVSIGLGFVTTAGCAATALLGCATIVAAAGMANVTLSGAMGAAADGNDPFVGGVKAMHDPSAWVGALFDGGIGGYFHFRG